MAVTPSLIARVIEGQRHDPVVKKRVEDLVVDELDECPTQWRIGKDEGLRLGSRLVVPDDAALRKEILQESHRSRFTIHPGDTKMYRDMRRTFWWEGMKRDVADFVDRKSTRLNSSHITRSRMPSSA